MNRILVTGAGGQLGKSIQDLAPEYPGLDFLFVDKVDTDITRADLVLEKFREYRPDYCINCAAYTNVEQAEKTPEPAYAVNVKGVENLAHSCKEIQTVLIHISTDYVFDGAKEEGYTPGDQPNPINVYGKTKWLGEQVIQDQLKRYFIIRTSWLYSKKYPPNFYLTILEKAKRGDHLMVTDVQTGCPTDAANLARHILELIGSGSEEYGISHFTDGVAMSWFSFAVKILKDNNLFTRGFISKACNYGTFAKRPKNSVLL